MGGGHRFIGSWSTSIAGRWLWGGMGRSWLLLVFVVVSWSFPSCSATPEADALLGMASSWGRTFPTWMGSDPCVNWEGVTCSSGVVVGLSLGSSQLTGPVPPAIGRLTSLTSLDLSNNAIRGPLPPEFAFLQNLQVLNLNRNPLNAPFSTEILQLRNLTELRYDVAGVFGLIPNEISNLNKLEILFLGNNSLVGPLPAKSIGSLLNLKQLTLWGGSFKSPLPPEFGNLVNLQYLNMHTSTLWGGLPPSWSNMKNISRMLLYNNDLTGYVPSSWQALTTLKQLHVGQNALSGSFPDWLVNIPIEILDMSRNSFQGPFPNLSANLPLVNATSTNMSLYCNYFNGSYPTFQLGNLVNFTGNCFTNESTRETDNTRNTCNRPFFCRDFFMRLEDGCAPCPAGNYIYDNKTICTCKPADYVDQSGGGGGFPYGEVIGGIVGSLALILALVALCKWDPIHKRLPFDPFLLFSTNDDDEDWDVPEGVHRFTMAELSKATGHFDREHEIGAGGFGKVFFGTLADGKMVAIKRASTTSLQGQIEFRNEVNLLSRLHHRHLVRLEGFCEDEDLQILVYEYMKNGNLGEHISRAKGSNVLSWYNRLEIAVGIAQGLDYLHSFADPPVIHRDIKPTNILLDEHMVAKVADFGISKATFDFDTHVSTRPAGTAGYLDPEYFLRRQLTTASDVYGYGVLLLEIVTGQQAIDHSRKEEFNLIEWVRPRFRERGVEVIVDAALEGNYDKDVFTDMTNVALMCASFNKNDRPAMKDVVSYLEPHVRMFQSLSSSNTDAVSSHRSQLRGSDLERLTRPNPNDYLSSQQFMTVPLHTAANDYSPFNTRRPNTFS
ncbi:hypothetical protein M758_5G097300 [Ceratodon purpureus]|nr:hypothetical protein M758_5G097300 [Ceratodon purpureus]